VQLRHEKDPQLLLLSLPPLRSLLLGHGIHSLCYDSGKHCGLQMLQASAVSNLAKVSGFGLTTLAQCSSIIYICIVFYFASKLVM
jgi:hypothetical protein